MVFLLNDLLLISKRYVFVIICYLLAIFCQYLSAFVNMCQNTVLSTYLRTYNSIPNHNFTANDITQRVDEDPELLEVWVW